MFVLVNSRRGIHPLWSRCLQLLNHPQRREDRPGSRAAFTDSALEYRGPGVAGTGQLPVMRSAIRVEVVKSLVMRFLVRAKVRPVVVSAQAALPPAPGTPKRVGRLWPGSPMP